MSKTITLKGDKEFVKALKKAMQKAPELTRKVMKNGAEFGKNVMQTNAPYDTRFLKDNIVTQYPSLNVALIVSQAMYSGYVNFGTRFMTARPYFTDGWTETQKKLIQDFNNVIKGAFE